MFLIDEDAIHRKVREYQDLENKLNINRIECSKPVFDTQTKVKKKKYCLYSKVIDFFKEILWN